MKTLSVVGFVALLLATSGLIGVGAAVIQVSHGKPLAILWMLALIACLLAMGESRK